MNPDVGPAAEELRAELRAWLAANHPGPAPKGPEERLAWQRAWAARLVDDGWAAPGWPKAWGGMALDVPGQYVYHQEMARARVPAHPSPPSFICGPTLVEHGTDAQRERFLRPMLRAEELWCQGFSEPEAGSDLTSLRTTARRDGDGYVVDGQKIWTSGAARADWMFALVRTGPPGRDGISYLLVDMRSEGVEVRPLRDMVGDAFFAEVFLTGVRVPVENLVGVENGGWSIARTTLGHERSTAFIANAVRYRGIVRQLVDVARERGRAAEPLVRQELASLETDARLLELNGFRELSRIVRQGTTGPTSSVNRLLHGQFERRLHEVAVDLLGASALLGARDADAYQRGRWVWGFLRTRASTIGAGTAEIQRNTIAERVLGLPPEDHL